MMTMGEMVKSMLTKLEWFDTRFPRIPVNVQVLHCILHILRSVYITQVIPRRKCSLHTHLILFLQKQINASLDQRRNQGQDRQEESYKRSPPGSRGRSPVNPLSRSSDGGSRSTDRRSRSRDRSPRSKDRKSRERRSKSRER